MPILKYIYATSQFVYYYDALYIYIYIYIYSN